MFFSETSLWNQKILFDKVLFGLILSIFKLIDLSNRTTQQQPLFSFDHEEDRAYWKEDQVFFLFSIHIYLLISTTSFINLQLFFVVLEEKYISHEKFWRRIFGFSKISVNYFGQNPEVVVYYFSRIEAENENKRYV